MKHFPEKTRLLAHICKSRNAFIKMNMESELHMTYPNKSHPQNIIDKLLLLQYCLRQTSMANLYFFCEWTILFLQQKEDDI